MRLKVGIAEIAVAQGDAVLEAIGLGSCVAVVFYDPQSKIGGMAHPLLPTSNGYKVGNILGKFMDLSLKELLEEMEEKNVKKENLIAKAAGGASIFSHTKISDVGRKNVEALKKILQEFKIPLVASDFGGNYGRTVEFHLKNAEMHIRSVRRGTIII